uniref:Uncharacterized protein n=1 Tax=Panagrolaimus sp. ES5 TaxID=591445 RepID=A0AC34F168_9BILA
MAWNAQSTATCLLAFNRCIDAYNQNLGKFLFGGYRIYFWMSLPLLYGGRFMLIGYPGIFSPIFSAIIFNPHIGYANDYNNSYTTLKKATNSDLKQATKVFGQVLLIAFSLFAIATGFLFMQNGSQLYRDIVAYSFVIFDGLPAVIYLTLNKTIRGNVKNRFFPCLQKPSNRV